MKLLRYLKAHLLFVLDRKNIIIIILFNILILFISIIISDLFKDSYILDSNRLNYLNLFNNNFYLFNGIIYIFFIIISSMNLFNKDYDSFSFYIIKNSSSKILFILSKYIFIFLYFFIELLFILLIYLVIIIIAPYGSLELISFKYFIKLYHLGLYYLLLSNFLINIFSSNYVSILSFLIYWLYNLIELVDNNSISSIIKYISININLLDLSYTVDDKIIYILIILLLLLNIIKRFRKK